MSFLRFICSGCARTLRLNRSNKWSIRFKSRRFAAVWVVARCLHVISTYHRSYVSLNGYTFCVRENVWARYFFSPYLMFFNMKYVPTKFNNTLPCTRSRTTWPIFAPTVSHWQFCTWKRFFFFPLIDRSVCTIKSCQTLDALIKYVAYYHSLYSGQLGIRLSVYILVSYLSYILLAHHTPAHVNVESPSSYSKVGPHRR